MVLENVSALLATTIICTSGIAIHQMTRCYGVGTKSLWVAKIDTYAMVRDYVLPLKAT